MSRHRPVTKQGATPAVARRERNSRAAVSLPLLLHLTQTARLGPGVARFVRRHLLAAHAMLRPPLREMSLALVGDARMAALHMRFMNVPGPTDVLTFPIDADSEGRALSAEVVVCVPEARRRAGTSRQNLERELLLYALHGLLHLCGYDDKTGPGFRRMHRREDMILNQLGVGPVFQADAVTPSRRRRGPRPAAPSGRAGRRSPR